MTAFASYPSLVDRPVLITGGATGIGADLVRGFAGQGALVAFLDVQDGPAAELVAELAAARHSPRYLHGDLAETARIVDFVAEAAALLGGVSVLVNNAANDQRHRIEAVTPDLWDALEAINLRAQFFAAQAVVPLMRAAGGGAIINLSSVAWRHGAAGMVAYGAAKAGVIGLTRGLARELGPPMIRVNAIEPGAVMTERQRRLWYPDQASVDALLDRQLIRIPVTGADIARMALFLASDDARSITSQTFVVDAGLS
jgi:NAD(P)-dependent dehydrogenase (short-subunit alcohol dehydrogenase family)